MQGCVWGEHLLYNVVKEKGFSGSFNLTYERQHTRTHTTSLKTKVVTIQILVGIKRYDFSRVDIRQIIGLIIRNQLDTDSPYLEPIYFCSKN